MPVTQPCAGAPIVIRPTRSTPGCVGRTEELAESAGPFTTKVTWRNAEDDKGRPAPSGAPLGRV